jgi:hypothetical protein
MILKLMDNDPNVRPTSKELFNYFQDQLYQNMIISNSAEYNKIMNFLFSDKNVFPSQVDQNSANMRAMATNFDM